MANLSLHDQTTSDAYERARQAALDARDLVAAIECRMWPDEALLLRAARIARDLRADRIERWTDWELRGYNPAEADALDMMDQTLRRTGEDTAHSLCAPLPVLQARLASLHDEERRIDPNTGAQRLDALRREAARLVAIRSAALAMLHAFATQVFSDRAHLLEPYERRVLLPATPPVTAAGSSDDGNETVDVSACIAALDAFGDEDADAEGSAPPPEVEPKEATHAELVFEEDDEIEFLIEAEEEDVDARQEEFGAFSDDGEEPPEPDMARSSVDETGDAASEADPSAESHIPVALLESEAPTESPGGDDEEPSVQENNVQDGESPRLGAAIVDILLSDADIDAIFAATEDDIADFDGSENQVQDDAAEEAADECTGDPGSSGLTRQALAADPFSHVDPSQRAVVERFVMAADSRAVGLVWAAEAALHRRSPAAAAEALQAQRHLIDTIADRVLPASEDALVVDHVRLPNEPGRPFCRLFAWLRLRSGDADAARPLRYALFHHYRRLDPDFFRPADAEEAEALIDRTFALLYRTLGWVPPEQQAEFAR